MKEWFDDIYQNITEYAESINCDGVEIIGRRGWISNFKKKDWKEEFVIMSKEFKKKKAQKTNLKVVNN